MSDQANVAHLEEFHKILYETFSSNADGTLDLLDSLSSNQSGQSIAELSLNAAFARGHASLYQTISRFDNPEQWKVFPQILQKSVFPYRPL